MSFLGDTLGFEGGQIKDWLKKAKSKPQQLLLGAGTPIGAKVWGGALGTKFEPFVDQMGGAYGGHTVSAFGNQDGGYYKRAQDKGIDTKAGGTMHDISHVVAAIMAGNYGSDKLFGFQGGGKGGQTGNMPMPQMQAPQQEATQPAPRFPTNPYLAASVLERGPVFRQRLAKELASGSYR